MAKDITKLFLSLVAPIVLVLCAQNPKHSKDPLFNKFQLLKLKQIRHFQILGFMYKFTHGLLPAGFKGYFCTQSDIHTYNTRTASLSALSISFARTNRRKKSLRIIGPYLWNDLPLNIRQSQSLASFKYHLKHYLLHNN